MMKSSLMITKYLTNTGRGDSMSLKSQNFSIDLGMYTRFRRQIGLETSLSVAGLAG